MIRKFHMKQRGAPSRSAAGSVKRAGRKPFRRRLLITCGAAVLSLTAGATAAFAAVSSTTPNGKTGYRQSGKITFNVYKKDAKTGKNTLLSKQVLNAKFVNTITGISDINDNAQKISGTLSRTSGSRDYIKLNSSTITSYKSTNKDYDNYNLYHYTKWPLTFHIPAYYYLTSCTADEAGEVVYRYPLEKNGSTKSLLSFMSSGNKADKRTNTISNITGVSSKDRNKSLTFSANLNAFGLTTCYKDWLNNTTISFYLTEKPKINMTGIKKAYNMDYGTTKSLKVKTSGTTGYKKIQLQRMVSGKWKSVKSQNISGDSKTYTFKIPKAKANMKYRVIILKSGDLHAYRKEFKVVTKKLPKEEITVKYPESFRKDGKDKYNKEYKKDPQPFRIKVKTKYGYPQTVTLNVSGENGVKEKKSKTIKKRKAGKQLSFEVNKNWWKKRNRTITIISKVKVNGETQTIKKSVKLHVTDFRERLLNYAYSKEGAVRGSKRHHQIINRFNTVKPDGWGMNYSAPWCATYTSACAIKAKKETKAADGYVPYVPLSANCGTLHSKAVKHKIWHKVSYKNKKLQEGDLLLFHWSGCSFAHVGAVITPKGGKVKTIEGNTHGKGHSSICIKKTRGKGVISGYITPKYAQIED